jgi:hypothetical protein
VLTHAPAAANLKKMPMPRPIAYLQLRHVESRPVRYMARYRLRSWLAAWRQYRQYQAAKREEWAAAAQRAQHTALCAAFAGCSAVAAEKAAGRRALQRAERLLGRLRLRQALAAWQGTVGSHAAWLERVAAAKQLRRRQLAQRALQGWRYIAWFQRAAREAHARQQLATLAACFVAWRQRAALVAATAALLAELAAARAARLASRAFGAWHAGVEGRQGRRQLEELNRWVGRLQQCTPCYMLVERLAICI